MEGVLCVRHIVPGLARNCIALSHIVPRLAIDSIASGTTSRARRMLSTLARILTRSTRHGFLLLAVLFMFHCTSFQSIRLHSIAPLHSARLRCMLSASGAVGDGPVRRELERRPQVCTKRVRTSEKALPALVSLALTSAHLALALALRTAFGPDAAGLEPWQ